MMVNYFEELHSLDKVRFKRCIKLPNVVPEVDPDLVTYNGGNPSVFGTVAYTLFEISSQSGGKYTALLIMLKQNMDQ